MLQSCREVPEPALPTHEHADRTVVIYMAANNSLGSNRADVDDVDDMDEMSAAMTGGQFPDSTKVVVFHAPYTNGKTLPLQLRTRRIMDHTENIPSGTLLRISRTHAAGSCRRHYTRSRRTLRPDTVEPRYGMDQRSRFKSRHPCCAASGSTTGRK